MSMYNDALTIKEEIIANRRHLHQNPELGLELPKTAAFVEEKLKEMGYEPVRVGDCGIVATIGKEGGKCIMLRADMDALPMEEQTGLDFASTNGCMHACGHDCHTANLLGAAKLLKMHENELEGKVKLMFQPAEETMDGGKMMVEAGVCKDVDVAVGMHIFGGLPSGTLLMMGTKAKMAAVDWFEIVVKGKGCHGASPNTGVDPINVAAHILLSLQALNARELDPADNLVLTIGQIHGGSTSNVLPNECMMSGTIRTLKNETRAMIKERMEAIVSSVAAAFRAEAQVIWGSGCPVLMHNAQVYADVKAALSTLEGVNTIDMDEQGTEMVAMGSEDFSYVANEVPSTFLGLGSGSSQYPAHHPKVVFDDNALPSGAAAYAHVAIEWLKNHK